jgi:hypothetical protein
MGWTAVPDTYQLSPSQKVRVDIGGGTVEIGTDETKIREYFTQYTGLEVTAVSRVLFWGWTVEGTTQGMPVRDLRQQAAEAVARMRDEWFVVAPNMAVLDIEVSTGGLEVPTTTAISLAAIAVIVLVGFVVYRSYFEVRK